MGVVFANNTSLNNQQQTKGCGQSVTLQCALSHPSPPTLPTLSPPTLSTLLTHTSHHPHSLHPAHTHPPHPECVCVRVCLRVLVFERHAGLKLELETGLGEGGCLEAVLGGVIQVGGAQTAGCGHGHE